MAVSPRSIAGSRVPAEPGGEAAAASVPGLGHQRGVCHVAFDFCYDFPGTARQSQLSSYHSQKRSIIKNTLKVYDSQVQLYSVIMLQLAAQSGLFLVQIGILAWIMSQLHLKE